MKATGEMVKNARNSRGWTQERLADKLHIKRANLARIESMSAISSRNTFKLDKAFGNADWRSEAVTVSKVLDSASQALIRMVIELADRVTRLEKLNHITAKPGVTVSSLRAIAQGVGR